MAFGGFGGGPGGPGGGHGGHGGPGGFGGHGFGHGGPGFGFGPGGFGFGPGFGMFGGYMGFGLGHFGPSGSFSAGGARSEFDPVLTTIFGGQFPDSVCADGPTGTAQERVDLFIINHHSIKRAVRWLIGMTLVLSVLVTLMAALAGNYGWSWILLVSPSFALSALCYSLRNLIDEIYGRQIANWVSAIACVPCFVAMLIALFTAGSPRVYFASALAFFVGSLVSNWVMTLVCHSQVIRGFDNDSKSYRARTYDTAVAGRFVELVIFLPLAFVGRLDFLAAVWLGACVFGLSFAVEFVLSPIVCYCRERLIYHLSAYSDQIIDVTD